MIEPRLLFATYVVTSAEDAGPGTLRQAILDANANPGADAIHFNLQGTGPFTIRPTANMPAATGTVVIDATTQPGFEGTPVVELAGDLLRRPPGTPYMAALTLEGDHSAVRGFAVNRFWSTASIDVDASYCHVAGNYFGITPAGTRTWTGQDFGVWVYGDGNLIGGTALGDRNVMAGVHTGISIGGDGNLVQGNLIGTAPDGATPIQSGPNGSGVGVYVLGNNNVIGGTLAAARNVISGMWFGVQFQSGTATGTVIQGNYIGTDISGTKAIPNGTGIYLSAGRNQIGGTASGAGNVIAGNGSGIQVVRDFEPGDGENVLEGNRIGVAADGSPLGNGGDGILIQGTSGNLIGGSLAAAKNEIAYNGGAGVRVIGDSKVPTPGGNVIRGNSIHSNGGLGIDLAGKTGRNDNDPEDIDWGPNGLQNYPELASATRLIGGVVRITGYLYTTANTPLKVDLYGSPTNADGQARVPITTIDVVTDSFGFASFQPEVALPGLARYLTATATAVLTPTTGGTSELSYPLELPLMPASVQSVVVNSGAAQRSMVTSITVTFDRQVVLSDGAFTLTGRNGAGAGTVLTSSNTSGDGQTYVLTFSGAGVTAGSLADGVYDLTIARSRVQTDNPAGPGMRADYQTAFHRLYGDINGDRAVGGADYFQFRKAYGSASPDPLLLDAFDVNGDGAVGGADYFQFRKRYGLPALESY